MAAVHRRDFLKASAGAVLGALAAPSTGCAPQRRPPRNALFVTVEDWNASVAGCYGNPVVRTPRLDAFAEQAVRFTRAYCQATVCNPSRASFLTGLRPETTGIRHNRSHMDELLPAGTRSLPELFKGASAYAANVGKLFHLGYMAGPQLRAFDRLELGEVPPEYPGVSTGYAPPPGAPPVPEPRFAFSATPEIEARLLRLRDERDRALAGLEPGGPGWHRAQFRYRREYSELLGDSGRSEEADVDGQRARLAAEILRERAAAEQPFLLCVGFTTPHTPLVAPRPYLDLYPPERMPAPAAPAERDRGIPPIALRYGRNFDVFGQVEATPERARQAIAAYYACVSFTDAQLGIVLDALEETGLASDTAVLVCADHGFHLGEHGLWSKATFFEQSTRVPLLVRVPGARGNGRSCDAIVELVDLIPTLCELFGFAAPQELEGTSFAPLLDDPERPWKSGAFSVLQRPQGFGRCLRTRRQRYSEWALARGHALELYDLEADPWEHVNLAQDPAHRETVSALAARLRAGWRAALPEV